MNDKHMTPIDEMRLVLTVDDFDYATAFFRDSLGLKQVAAFENDGGHGVLLDAGRATLEIFDHVQARAIDEIEVGRRVAGQVRVAFRTADSELAANKLVAAGAELIAGPVMTPWRDRNVRLMGPEGVQLTLFTPTVEQPGAMVDSDYLVFNRDELTDSELQGIEAGGVTSLIFIDSRPGEGPRLHRHPYHEIFIVLEGRTTFTVGTQSLAAGAGQIVVVRPGVAHKFVNSGTGPLRQLDIHASSEFITEWLE